MDKTFDDCWRRCEVEEEITKSGESLGGFVDGKWFVEPKVLVMSRETCDA